MNPPSQCPFCGSRKLFLSHFLNEGGGVGSSWVRFQGVQPFPWWQFASAGNKDAIREVEVSEAAACLGCGRLWTQFDLKRALELVQRHGSPEMNAKLAAMDQPPH